MFVGWPQENATHWELKEQLGKKHDFSCHAQVGLIQIYPLSWEEASEAGGEATASAQW